MAGSAIEAVTEYAYNALRAAEGLEGVSVLWGPPSGDDTPQEAVLVGFGPDGESWNAERDWVGIGRTTLDETFTLELQSVALYQDGPDLGPTFRRSVAIAEAVEAVLRADPHFSEAKADAQLRNVRFSAFRGRYFRVDKARGHRVFQTITGIARI